MLITVQEAAERLNVCKKTILRRIADGSLKASRLSYRCIRIDTVDLESFIEKRKMEKPKEDKTA